MFSSEFVCSFASLFVSRITQNFSTDFTKFGEKVAHGLWKKPLDFWGDQVTLGSGLRPATVGWGQRDTPQTTPHERIITRRSFNSTNFATEAALAEECIPSGAILFENVFHRLYLLYRPFATECRARQKKKLRLHEFCVR